MLHFPAALPRGQATNQVWQVMGAEKLLVAAVREVSLDTVKTWLAQVIFCLYFSHLMTFISFFNHPVTLR